MDLLPSNESLLSQLKKIVRVEIWVLINLKLFQLSIMDDYVKFIYKFFPLRNASGAKTFFVYED